MEPIFILLIILFFYFLPTIMASSRNHNNAGAIFALNLLFGWTFIGWAIAFIWACTDNRQ